LFVARDGKLAYEHIGPYESETSLEDDVARYALGR
jgi:hypothetical protein